MTTTPEPVGAPVGEPPAGAPTKPASRLKGRLLTGLKLVVAVGLLGFLLYTNKLDTQKIGRAFTSPAALGLVMVLGAIGISTSGLRWWLLLRAEGIQASVGLAVRLTWVGHFWNMVIPGAVSGDGMKMYYIGRAFPAKREEAWTTVFADRLIGMAALVAVSSAATASDLAFMTSRRELQATAAVMFAILVVMLGLFLALSLGLGRHTKVADSLRSKLPLADMIRRGYHVLLRLGERPKTVLLTFCISFMSHATAVVTATVLGHAVGETRLSFTQYCVIFPVALFSNTIPITPGGIGVGEGTLGKLFEWSGGHEADGVAIMLLYRLNFFVMAAVGAALYVAHKNDPAPDAPRDA